MAGESSKSDTAGCASNPSRSTVERDSRPVAGFRTVASSRYRPAVTRNSIVSTTHGPGWRWAGTVAFQASAPMVAPVESVMRKAT